ncbi:MAG: hypothetical protein K2N67_08100 [Mucispirillum sp.]|nr:hypothetical protein [Mucispirillum sp.]
MINRKVFNKINAAMLLFCIIVIIPYYYFAYKSSPYYMGEWGSNMFNMYAIAEYGQIYITPDIFEECKNNVANNRIGDFYQSFHLFSNDRQKAYGWYFPLYSFLCVPAYYIQKITNGSITIAPMITNIALLLIAALFIIFKLKSPPQIRFLLLSLILVSPIVYYLNWISSEVCIYSLLTISLVFLFNKEFKKAVLFVSMAATMNPVIYILGAGYFFIYLYELSKDNKIYDTIKGNIKDILKTAACFFPFMFLVMYVYIATGKIGYSTVMYLSDIAGAPSRFIAYIMDLNFGFLPYVPLLMAVFLLITLIAVIEKRWDITIYAVSFIAFIFGYSVIIHINCGHTGIHRYVAFSLPALFFFVTVYPYNIFVSDRRNVIFYRVVMIAGILSFLISAVYAVCFYGNVYSVSYTRMQPAAKFVLNHAPSLYSPLFSTFNSRLNHIDGGYAIRKPAVYIDEKTLEVRKILMDNEFKSRILTYMEGKSKEDTDFLLSEIAKHENAVPAGNTLQASKPAENEKDAQLGIYAKHNFIMSGDKSLYYIDIPRKYHIYYNIEDLFPSGYRIDLSNGEDTVRKRTLFKNGKSFHYASLEKGSYTLSIEGDNLDNVSVTALSGHNAIGEIKVLENSGNKVVLDVFIPASHWQYKITVENMSDNNMSMTSIILKENM